MKLGLYHIIWDSPQLLSGLKLMHRQDRVTAVFKARNGLIDIPLDNLNSNSRVNRKGSCQNYTMPVSNVDSHLHSFYPSTIRLEPPAKTFIGVW